MIKHIQTSHPLPMTSDKTQRQMSNVSQTTNGSPSLTQKNSGIGAMLPKAPISHKYLRKTCLNRKRAFWCSSLDCSESSHFERGDWYGFSYSKILFFIEIRIWRWTWWRAFVCLTSLVCLRLLRKVQVCFFTFGEQPILVYLLIACKLEFLRVE